MIELVIIHFLLLFSLPCHAVHQLLETKKAPAINKEFA
jgi:hypothetical protein